MLHIPTSLPKASSNMLSPQGGAGGDPTLPSGPWPGGSETLHSWGYGHHPYEPTMCLLTDGSIISIQLLFARGSCNQRLHVYSGKINHNC